MDTLASEEFFSTTYGKKFKTAGKYSRFYLEKILN